MFLKQVEQSYNVRCNETMYNFVVVFQLNRHVANGRNIGIKTDQSTLKLLSSEVCIKSKVTGTCIS